MTLATVYPTSNQAGVDLTATYTASTAGTFGENVQPGPPFLAGYVIDMTNGGRAVFVKLSTGGSTGTGYLLVAPLSDYTACVMMTSSVGNLGDPVGVCLNSAAAVSGDYVWMQTKGLCAALQVAASCVHNVALASTATAGVVDDSVAGGTKNLPGLFSTVTVTSAAATPAELNFPTVGSTN